MVSGASDLIEVCVDKKIETSKAILVSDGDKEIWLPKSQIEIEPGKNGTVTITLPEWLAMDKGLI